MIVTESEQCKIKFNFESNFHFLLFDDQANEMKAKGLLDKCKNF